MGSVSEKTKPLPFRGIVPESRSRRRSRRSQRPFSDQQPDIQTTTMRQPAAKPVALAPRRVLGERTNEQPDEPLGSKQSPLMLSPRPGARGRGRAIATASMTNSSPSSSVRSSSSTQSGSRPTSARSDPVSARSTARSTAAASTVAYRASTPRVRPTTNKELRRAYTLILAPSHRLGARHRAESVCV